jgi:hypothetical protein
MSKTKKKNRFNKAELDKFNFCIPYLYSKELKAKDIAKFIQTKSTNSIRSHINKTKLHYDEIYKNRFNKETANAKRILYEFLAKEFYTTENIKEKSISLKEDISGEEILVNIDFIAPFINNNNNNILESTINTSKSLQENNINNNIISNNSKFPCSPLIINKKQQKRIRKPIESIILNEKAKEHIFAKELMNNYIKKRVTNEIRKEVLKDTMNDDTKITYLENNLNFKFD